jgi:hypothetical protein
MAYSKGQLEAIWEAANPGNGNPHLMAAIALAESGGSAAVVNSIGACGLWQIHPYQDGCTNPMANARMAGEKLRSQGLGAWETYTNGAYKQYYTGVEDVSLGGDILKGLGTFGNPLAPALEAGEIAGEAGLPNPITEGENQLGKATGLTAISKFFELISSKQGWLRIGKIVIGVFLLLSGVLGMANISAPSPIEVGKKAAKVAAVGAVA